MTDRREPLGEIILYQTDDGRTRVECRFADDTLWLSQALLAELFQVSVPTINEHLKGIYEDAELEAGATIRNFRIVRSEGGRAVSRGIEHYSKRFAERRRLMIEAEAERAQQKALEAATRCLPEPVPKPTRRPRKKP